MKKKGTLVYSLTTRGLFSELSNLVMAFYYANQKGLNFIINSRYWNGKIKGSSDISSDKVNIK